MIDKKKTKKEVTQKDIQEAFSKELDKRTFPKQPDTRKSKKVIKKED